MVETAPNCEVVRARAALYGAVQGVGFRPFVFRLATELGLSGWVLNSGAGLVAEVEGASRQVSEFLNRLEAERPTASRVLASETTWLAPSGVRGFQIRESDETVDRATSILPDLAICPDCLAEITNSRERRHQYPFTNCTQCGPRYSIVLDIPYDRANTTMRAFSMCADCAREYGDPRDRRFHAQPIACPICGPKLDAGIEEAAMTLSRGEIVALKGIGGFQLLADARDERAVGRLRGRKHRDAKPFALMMPDLETVRRYCLVSAEEERTLTSSAAPIVLLEPNGDRLAPNVSDASPYLGVMLPYSPLHHLLLRAFPHPVIATSGNLSGDTIVTENSEALRRLGGIADLFVTHDRLIARPCDDSVVRIVRGREMVLRRARGYSPLPVRVRQRLPRVLATGAHMKNAIAIAVGNDVYLSQHIGDLDTLESRRAFENAIADLCRLYDFEPDVVACDLHPDYASTQWAHSSRKPVLPVQHHIAHAVACAAENDVQGTYFAVTWDGTGYGLDGTVWGGEFFVCEGPRFERVRHLRPFLLPGGEAAIHEGWRSAASLLWTLGEPIENAVIRRMLERKLNAPFTTSIGRLFDAVASITEVAQCSLFEGQAAMLLERFARDGGNVRPYEIAADGDWAALVREVRADIRNGVPPSDCALGFHHALAAWIEVVAREIGEKQVVLSGGVFQNALLTQLAYNRLESAGFRAFTHQRIPPNDGGIALGQAVVAGML